MKSPIQNADVPSLVHKHNTVNNNKHRCTHNKTVLSQENEQRKNENIETWTLYILRENPQIIMLKEPRELWRPQEAAEKVTGYNGERQWGTE